MSMNPYRIDNEPHIIMKTKKEWYGWRGFIKLCVFLTEKFISLSRIIINFIINSIKHPIYICKVIVKILIMCVGFLFLPLVIMLQLLRYYGGEPEDTKTLCSEIINHSMGSEIEPIQVFSGIYCICFIIAFFVRIFS